MNENEFEHEGKVYVAKVVLTNLCFGCAFNDKSPEYCVKLPVSCLPKKRKDCEIVIFKEKQQ